MNSNIILCIYCHLKPDQVQDGHDVLFQMANSLEMEVETDSDFTISSGSASNASDVVVIHLNTDVPRADYDVQQAREIVNNLFGRLNLFKKYIDVQTSEVKYSFAIDEGDVASEDNKYTYTLEEVLPL